MQQCRQNSIQLLRILIYTAARPAIAALANLPAIESYGSDELDMIIEEVVGGF